MEHTPTFQQWRLENSGSLADYQAEVIQEQTGAGMIQGEWYTPAELHDLPSLGTGQADEQVGETGKQRVWYGRTEDSPQVSVETLDHRGNWVTTYEGSPARIRIGWDNKVEMTYE